jgi:methenyltetrahydromethanopterin cyclohydrolase
MPTPMEDWKVPLTLNERAAQVVDEMVVNAADLRISVSSSSAGARIIDCGIATEGGLEAGLGLARVCLAGLADVRVVPGEIGGAFIPQVQVMTDWPVLACMASQYAGWQISVGKYFAMGSGPMRAAYGKEELFDKIPGREKPNLAVGILETKKLPGEEAINFLCGKLGLEPSKLTLLAAPTSSQAGTVQIVSRSLETALHKLYELKFDLTQVVSGIGLAPLAPVAAEDMQAIGWTNDAILYGGRVAIWVRADDDQIASIGPRVPSGASPDFGEPFAAIFKRYNHDFYKIDPMLFSPAEIVFHNLKTGRSQAFGRVAPEILKRSFFPHV